jgi:hypothetical protein
MPERGTRESSLEYCAELRARGRLFRQQLVEVVLDNLPAEPSAPPPLSRIERHRGSLSGSLAWVANPAVGLNPQVVSALGLGQDSLLFDTLFGVAGRALEQAGDPPRWAERTPPVILPYRGGRLRFGIFDWTTDQDAFIEALLGRPVPRRPRYQPSGPVLPVRFESEFDFIREQLGATIDDTIDLFGMSAGDAAGQRGPLDGVAAHMAGDDAVRTAVQQAAVQIDPDGFSASPVGKLTLGVLRSAPRWRTPGAQMELAGAYDLGIGGSVGLAFWSGATQLRSSRAAMAAHLRYLFDYEVAPQNRWPDARTRHEAMTIWVLTRYAAFAEPGQRVTRPNIARVLRGQNPADYGGEDEGATVRRLYRLSAAMRRPNTAAPGQSGA